MAKVGIFSSQHKSNQKAVTDDADSAENVCSVCACVRALMLEP